MPNVVVGAKPSACFRLHGGGWSPIDFEAQFERDIIAAVAEVEWRKRAERWRELYRKIIEKYTIYVPLTGKDADRVDKYVSQENAAYKTAEAWRAWAEEDNEYSNL